MTRLATRAAILGVFASSMAFGLSAGCGNDQVEIGRSETLDDAAAGSGGATGSGGVTGTGGATQLGGATGVGGVTGTGGATQLGGATGAGGTGPGAGGATPIGGKTETGSGGVAGTTEGSGGTPAAGGKTGTGGNTGAGGTTAAQCGSDGQCQTADAGVRDATIQPDAPAETGRDGPLEIMTPTLPAPCTTDTDCCVAMDICMATAYLVGKAEFDAMVASVESVHVPYTTSCLSCIHPAVQVQCQAGVCAGEELAPYGGSDPLAKSHCGTLSTNPSDGGSMSRASAFFATKWGCGI